MSYSGASPFRFRATTVDHAITRPRLLEVLRGRFDARITTVVAPAGAGKTTLLALAMGDNQIEPAGVDVWLGGTPVDREPARVLAGLAAALGAPVSDTADLDLGSVVEAVWAHAPNEVALIIDDAHHLHSPATATMLEQLLATLPDNGHLVLVGRSLPTLALARWRALGELIELGASDLELDDHELDALIRLRARPDAAAGLPRLAALADLSIRVGAAAGQEFLWEEVLGALGPERLAALSRCSLFESIDDALVGALSDDRFTALELLDQIPLVEITGLGDRRMHSLLRSALATRLSAEDRALAGRLAAGIASARGDHAAAVAAFEAGGHIASALAAARQFAMLPTLTRNLGSMVAVRDCVERIAPGSVLARYLRADTQTGELTTNTDIVRLAEHLHSLAVEAHEGDDAEVEALALTRSMQLLGLHDIDPPTAWIERLEQLASTVPFAAQMTRLVQAELCMWDAEPEQALVHAAPQPGDDPVIGAVMLAMRLIALGRPEEVGLGLTADDLSRLPPGADSTLAFAIWVRGDVTPELAMAISRPVSAQARARRVVHTSVATLGTTACIALAAGDLASAGHDIAEARAIAQRGCARQINAFVDAAHASLVCTADGDEAGARVVAEMLERMPLKRWPTTGYQLALPLIYVLSPSSRDALDHCRFGPTASMGLDAARALIELRDNGRPDLAAGLPWGREAALRALVISPHLCELAVAAGTEEAVELLAKLPDHRRHVRRLASLPGAMAARAQEVLRRFPARPEHRLSISTLGQLAVWRDDVLVDDRDWTRRARVQELAAVLVTYRRLSRARIADMLWPDLDADKAMGNLRVTLSYLQRVFEPDRDAYAGPYFVRAEGDLLVLAPDVDVDIDRFEADLARAHELDRMRAPRMAIDAYVAALARYNGDYLAGLEAEWLDDTRSRLQVIALTAFCRVGELELARGEPEQALTWAHRAWSIDDHNERAGRLLASCRQSCGDRSGAVRVMRQLMSALEHDALAPEPDTITLLRRLGIQG